MASPKTKELRDPPRPLMVYVCARCRNRGGTLQRSEGDGLLYHPGCLPEVVNA